MSSSVYSRLHGIFTKTPKLNPITTTTTTTIPKISPPEAPVKISTIVRNFKKCSNLIWFRRNHRTYEATVRRLVAEKQFNAIENILEHQKKYKDSITDEGFAVRLISLYGKAKMFTHARKLFDELPSLACNRTVMSFNALLHACVSSEQYTKIPEIFKEIPENLSIKPDTISYNTVIKSFCEMGELDSAINIINSMKEPNVISYNTILHGYYKNNMLSEAEKIWDLMEEKNVIPNIRSYNVKIRGLVGNDRVIDALKLIKEMEEKEVKPDVFSYNAVIKGFIDEENLEEVKNMYEKILENGLVPDLMTFRNIIEFACDKNDFDYAIELCKKGVELKQHLYQSVMMKLIDELVERSRFEEANELVELVNSSYNLRYRLKLA